MILFTSVIEVNGKKASKTSFVYLLISLFCVLFGAVYEIYSHEVYSYFMLYAFAFPLAGGTLPFSIFTLIKIKRYPNALSRNLYHFGIATLTVGSIIRGVLDIYGTTNALSEWYWRVGAAFVIAGVLVHILSAFFKSINKDGGLL